MKQLNHFRQTKTFCVTAGVLRDMKLVERAVIASVGGGDEKNVSIIAIGYDSELERYSVRVMHRRTLALMDIEYEIVFSATDYAEETERIVIQELRSASA